MIVSVAVLWFNHQFVDSAGESESLHLFNHCQIKIYLLLGSFRWDWLYRYLVVHLSNVLEKHLQSELGMASFSCFQPSDELREAVLSHYVHCIGLAADVNLQV
jgi:hypothetical protein